MTCVRSIGKGAMHFVGLAKMGKTKYTISGKKKNAAELILQCGKRSGSRPGDDFCYCTANGRAQNYFSACYARNKIWNKKFCYFKNSYLINIVKIHIQIISIFLLHKSNTYTRKLKMYISDDI